jgi:transposase
MENLAEQALRLQQQVRRLGGVGTGRRYPRALRKALTAHAEARQAEGATLEVIGSELGMSSRTLWYWLRKQPEVKRQARARLLPVQVVEAQMQQQQGSIVVHGPRGMRIDGLDVATLAELLQRLS